ncbi:MAG: RNA polymerase sigma-70 factor [Cytophagales bacterium]|nr:RNA polymerase sigma-70 factor [Cytophagales bacterium]
MAGYRKNSDDDIIALLRCNNVQAINKLYDLHYHSLIRLAFKILGDNEVAKDIIQELFLNIWLKRHHLSIKRPIESYLAKSVINRCLNYLRDSPRIHHIPGYFIDRVEKNIGEEALIYDDLERLTKMAIDSLPPKCKLIFNLSRSGEMSNKNIALTLGISIKVVEKQITKALKHLRHCLKPYLSTFLYFMLV